MPRTRLIASLLLVPLACTTTGPTATPTAGPTTEPPGSAQPGASSVS
jgi:hypothetical protein